MAENAANDHTFRFGEFELFPSGRLLSQNGNEVRLSPRILDALILLVEARGEVVKKEVMIQKLWPESFVEENNLSQAISALRKALGTQENGKSFIETVPKTGFRLAAQVSESRREDPVLATTQPLRRSLYLKLIAIAGVFVLGIAAIAAFTWLRKAGVHTMSAEKNVPIRLTTSDVDETKPEFTADGRIRFYRDGSYVVNTDGSGQQRNETIINLDGGSWSPDGSKVMFYKVGDRKAAYFANADGSGEVKLPFTFGNAHWSPDGKRFLYQSGIKTDDGGLDSNIYLYDTASGEVATIVESPFFDGDPSFTPDGNSILFSSDRDGNYELYSKALETGEIKRLTVDPSLDAFPRMSPDGTQILFISQRDKEDADIFVMNADGTNVRRVTDLPSNEGGSGAAWSRDGTKILFVSDLSGKANIYMINFEPFAPTPLFKENSDAIPSIVPVPGRNEFIACVELGADRFEIRSLDTAGNTIGKIALTSVHSVPRISPDGSRIAFTDKIDGNSDIFVVPTTGGAPQNVSNHPNTDMLPAWSPDGKRIAFSSNRGDNRAAFAIFTMNADGSDVRQLYYANSSAHSPTYSPDGRRIIFNDDKIGGKIGNFELFSINGETGGDEQRLTFRRRYDVQPAISPDGKHIAFVSDFDGNNEIYVANIDGSARLRLTRDAAEDNFPVWSNDGQNIYFSTFRNNKFEIYSVRPF